MHRPRAFKPLLWIMAIALVGVQASGAHVHLCLDGHEPRTSIRAADGSLCETDAEQTTAHHGDRGHQDQDVDTGGVALAKKGSVDDHAAASAAIYVLSTLLPPAKHVAAPLRDDLPPPEPPGLLLPPLRGPPA